MVTAWRARAAIRVGLAPMRSATMPVPTRPKMDEKPESPRIPAAAILDTPWSMACVTRWKIGPACAAQQPKWVSAIAQNGQVRIAPSAV